LCNIPRLGNKKIEALLNIFNEPKEIYKASPKLIKASNILTDGDISYFNESKLNSSIYNDYLKMLKKNIKMITIADRDYPKRLKDIYDRPVCLYVAGKLPDEHKPSAALVGARQCSEYGRYAAYEISRQLSQAGVNIISGMARGIDTAAHKGCLSAGGYTAAVLAGGVDLCYPKENIELYMDLIDKCGVISEYPPGMPHYAGHFPLRNRIISALADIITVVEAREKSGSLITVDMALEQNKTVMALPGRVTDKLSAGCNNLIRQGAGIVCSAKDILDILSIESVSNPLLFDDGKADCDALHGKKNINTLARVEEMLYSCLDLTPKNINQLIIESGLDMAQVAESVISLEFKGFIKECGQGFYIRG
jgi:DNA processing protein